MIDNPELFNLIMSGLEEISSVLPNALALSLLVGAIIFLFVTQDIRSALMSAQVTFMGLFVLVVIAISITTYQEAQINKTLDALDTNTNIEPIQPPNQNNSKCIEIINITIADNILQKYDRNCIETYPVKE